MNILVEPIYIGLVQSILSLFLISGIIYFGKIINVILFKKYDFIYFNLLISLIIFSQILKISSYVGFFKEINFILSYSILLFGIYNLKNLFSFSNIKDFLLTLSKMEILIILFLLILFIISISPPSMADALDYHYGIPMHLLKFNQIPSLNLWLYGNVGGNGDIFNSIAIYLGSDNFGSLIQLISILLFFLFIKKEINNKNKINFLIIFILSSPTILQLLSGPKFMLLPQLMTATALYFFVKIKKIEVIDFIFIAVLLMGAAQFKSSFIISSSLIGFLTFYKALRFNKIKILFYTSLLTVIFFAPTAIWNFSEVSNFNLINIFTPMPDEMMNNMKSFRENHFIYPLNLLIPDSFGKISTIIGFQFLLLFFSFKKTKQFKSVILITLGTILIHSFIGMNVGRMYFEFILWLAISFIFINDKKINYNFYTKLILPQFLLVFCLSFYFAATSVPTIFSNKSRDSFMIKNSNYYASIKWINNTLPLDAKVISGIRSVSLLKNEFAPTDWLDFDIPKNELIGYFNLLKEKKMNYIVFVTDTLNHHSFKNCVGPEFAQSSNFIRATRNPLNRKGEYRLSIYHFDYKKLPSCFIE